ncbi:hypothetical protein [Leptolyngbya sp. FACHB-17]|uniref:hypothetical protein n=1 Tax=unclassified Leptolyngbya TaxID=2650499 RepID=UPI0016802AB0|nr:hypothetical protein [Leptolyngbya sp. FACHB-17]MBD2079233.1 hypothetical protein [Leptolyngbya sp. FACHB-17]
MIMTPKSGLFLGMSCVAAIAAVGCVFELTSGKPEYGTVVTGAILAISAPLTIVSFIVAVADARANNQ